MLIHPGRDNPRAHTTQAVAPALVRALVRASLPFRRLLVAVHTLPIAILDLGTLPALVAQVAHGQALVLVHVVALDAGVVVGTFSWEVHGQAVEVLWIDSGSVDFCGKEKLLVNV